MLASLIEDSGHHGNRIRLSVKALERLHPALRRRVVRGAVLSVRGELRDVTARHIEDVLGLISFGRSGRRLCLPGLDCGRSFDAIWFKPAAPRHPARKGYNSYEYALTVPGKLQIPEGGRSHPGGGGECHFPSPGCWGNGQDCVRGGKRTAGPTRNAARAKSIAGRSVPTARGTGLQVRSALSHGAPGGPRSAETRPAGRSQRPAFRPGDFVGRRAWSLRGISGESRCSPGAPVELVDGMSDLVKPAVFFGEEKIRERILDIGRRITADYDGSDVALVGILKGTIVFMADLIRAIDRPLTCDFLNVELSQGSADRHRVQPGDKLPCPRRPIAPRRNRIPASR